MLGCWLTQVRLLSKSKPNRVSWSMVRDLVSSWDLVHRVFFVKLLSRVSYCVCSSISMLNSYLGYLRAGHISYGSWLLKRHVFILEVPRRVKCKLIKATLVHWQIIDLTCCLLSYSTHWLILLLLHVCLWAVTLLYGWRVHVKCSRSLR